MTAGSVFDYSKTPGSNTTIAGINIAAGCPSSSVGPAIRQHLADIAESVAHTIVAGGTADALTITFTNIPATLTDGMQLNVRAGAANATTTPTLTTNVTGDTGHTITKRGGAALVAGDIAGALAEHTFRYNLASTRWELIDPSSVALATLALTANDLASLPIASIWTTGDVKITMKTAADTGWVIMNDGSIGDASSGGTTRANADTSALFTLLWTNTANADLAIQDSTGSASTRGVSAAADFAAHKRMPLPKMLGRALSLAGAGSGLTSRALGSIFGSETHSISVAEMPAHAHPGSTGSFAATNSVSAQNQDSTGTGFVGTSGTLGSVAATYTPAGTVAVSVASQGSGTAMNLMQPASFLNVMIKL